jgi:DNA polymerase elongation subunit (family B)
LEKNADVEYYGKNQMVPAALRILEGFGTAEANLMQ